MSNLFKTFILGIFSFVILNFISPIAFGESGNKKIEKTETVEITEEGDKHDDKDKDRHKEDHHPDYDIHKSSIGVGIGQTTLRSGFKYNGDDRITADLFYAYSASYSWDLIVNGHKSEHEEKGRWVKLSSINMGFKGKFYQYDAFMPFALAGLGFYRPETRRDVNGTMVTSKAKTVFGYTLGAGLDLLLNKNFSIGFLGQFHKPAEVEQDNGPAVNGSYYKLLITTFFIFD
jgi:hypothetical protein